MPDNDTPADPTPKVRRSPWHTVRQALNIIQVRLRFVVVLAVAFLIVGKWDVLRNSWDRLTHRSQMDQDAISPDTEYWCPMCPGVISDWPSKCPVCHMTLVRRKKGEAVPLPDGVLARMQFSPYRLQLAGIRTSFVEFRPLVVEIVTVGIVESPTDATHAAVTTEVFEPDLPFLLDGQSAEVASAAFPGRTPFTGRVVMPANAALTAAHSLRLRVDVADPEHELRAGMSPTVRIRSSVPQLPWFGRVLQDEWRDRTLLDLLGHDFGNPVAPGPEAGLASLAHSAVHVALARKGLALAVPDTAVLDTGKQKIVYIESGPGMFDAVEIIAGPRCGEFFPVLRGLSLGQRVATSGAFLIDAETRLNPNVAAAYFGAGRAAPSGTTQAAGGGALTQADKNLAAIQKTCPVTGEPLDSMGGPYKVVIDGRVVFLCCKGCEKDFIKNAKEYLSKLPK